MEDEDNLSKSSQKIMRASQERHKAELENLDADNDPNADGEFILREL